MESDHVLNPRLYNALRRRFGEVQVQNRGRQFRYKPIMASGMLSEVIRLGTSEEYVLKCPVCKDHSFRLNINHVFGTVLKCGIPMFDTAHCWNCEKQEVLRVLRDMVENEECDLALPALEVKEAVSPDSIAAISAAEHKKVGVKSLASLPAEHPAIKYLYGRGFLPDALEQYLGVGLALDSLAPAYHRRVYIPMLYPMASGETIIVGYQARAVDGYSSHDKPKYRTSVGCQKSAFLYNMHNARHFPNGGIVVEGPTKMWNIGFPSVGMWGRSLSEYQAQHIAHMWGAGTGPIGVYADPGWEAECEKNVEFLKRFIPDKRRVIPIYPYDMNDCGDIPYDTVWNYIDFCTDKAGLPRLDRGKKVLTWR